MSRSKSQGKVGAKIQQNADLVGKVEWGRE